MNTRGFTLLEIAIAMAILGLGVVSALQVFGGSTQLARKAGKQSEAVMHAKALMDSALWAPELMHTVSHGEIGNGFRWQRNIRPAGPEDGIPEREFRPELSLSVVSVVIEWDEPTGVKSYTVGTMRVEPTVEE
jgi:prepilin-type N-terminal cleavage/methylation domain-containing protein